MAILKIYIVKGEICWITMEQWYLHWKKYDYACYSALKKRPNSCDSAFGRSEFMPQRIKKHVEILHHPNIFSALKSGTVRGPELGSHDAQGAARGGRARRGQEAEL